MNLFYVGYFTMLIGLVLVYQDASAGLLFGVVGAAEIFFWLLSKWFNIDVTPRLDGTPFFKKPEDKPIEKKLP